VKANDLRRNSHCTICYYWPQNQRVVRMTGIMVMNEEETERVAMSMDPVEYRINCSTRQSETLNGGYEALIDILAQAASAEDTASEAYDRSNCQLAVWQFTANETEFWSGGSARFHNRFVYKLEDNGITKSPPVWKANRLWP